MESLLVSLNNLDKGFWKWKCLHLKTFFLCSYSRQKEAILLLLHFSCMKTLFSHAHLSQWDRVYVSKSFTWAILPSLGWILSWRKGEWILVLSSSEVWPLPVVRQRVVVAEEFLKRPKTVLVICLLWVFHGREKSEESWRVCQSTENAISGGLFYRSLWPLFPGIYRCLRLGTAHWNIF